uniref:Uncharacterized protein n=1 Tax=Sphaerodactylus townsendi TaxID=933632 RepID=A0ACB8EKY7_9SAUR
MDVHLVVLAVHRYRSSIMALYYDASMHTANITHSTEPISMQMYILKKAVCMCVCRQHALCCPGMHKSCTGLGNSEWQNVLLWKCLKSSPHPPTHPPPPREEEEF